MNHVPRRHLNRFRGVLLEEAIERVSQRSLKQRRQSELSKFFKAPFSSCRGSEKLRQLLPAKLWPGMLRHCLAKKLEAGEPRHGIFVSAENLHRARGDCIGQHFSRLVRIDRAALVFM